MPHMLVIRSSANGARSVSNQLIDGFVAAVTAPDLAVVDRDLDRHPVPHIRSETLAGIGRPAPETDAAVPTRALSDALIAELQAADLIVLGVPMYNFGMPSTLKSWFDHVLRAGVTFRYTAAGPEGLLTGKRALIVATRAGHYSNGDSAASDHQLSHVRTLLNFIGVTEIEVILAESLAFGEDAVAASVGAAREKLQAAAHALHPLAA